MRSEVPENGFVLSGFLRQNRNKVIEQWVDRLHTEVSERYSSRPREELLGTVSEAFDANYHVLVDKNYSFINRFINKITKMRLESGFLLSDVQKAFELYGSIVIPLLAKETEIDNFRQLIININDCLSYTIHRFSEYFQDMHQKEILEHNRILEEKVRIRTAELRESEIKYKTLVEEINDGYFVIQDEVIVFANKAFCHMHGYGLTEVIGKKFHAFVDPESRKNVIEIYNKSFLRQASPRVFEYDRLTKDGQSYPTEILAKTTRYEDKLSNIGICRDITERVRMEQRVREAERMAYIGEITTSLSHEIRNPLSAVNMNLQILKKNPQLRGNDRRRIDISVREVKRLERILKEILDYAKPLFLEFGYYHINEILYLCAELLEIKFSEKALRLVWSADPDMEDMFLDGEKLEQAFINLLLNSVEASKQGGKIWVKTVYSSKGESRGAKVFIEDEGQGVKEEHRDKIFKPFFTTKSKGTGLGLSNAKRIIEAHGGLIEMSSRQPRGASFKISIPSGGLDGTDSRSR